MIKKISVILSFVLLNLFVLFGCHSLSESELHGKYKDDAFYFEGIKKIKEKNVLKATDCFRKAAKNGSYYCSKNSYLNLLGLVDAQECLSLSAEMYSKFQDEESAVVYVRELYKAKEWTKILVFADNVDFKLCDDELAYFILNAFYENQFSGFVEKLYDWWTYKTISDFHVKFLKEHEALFDDQLFDFQPTAQEFLDIEPFLKDEVSPEIATIAQFFPDDESRIKFCRFARFRIFAYKRDYRNAFGLFSSWWKDFPKSPRVYSDAGKTCLYASNRFLKYAQFFETEANSLDLDDPYFKGKSFYANFYAGRFYEKVTYTTAAEKFYIAAMEASPSSENFDNALWYLLDMSLKKSSEKAAAYVIKWCSHWNDPDYFDDCLDILSNLLLSERKFSDFAKVYDAVYPYASKEMAAQFAYVSGRLIEAGLVKNRSEEEKIAAWKRSLNCGSQYYYKIMAAKRLGYTNEMLEKELYAAEDNTLDSKKTEVDESAGILLQGYADFGLASMIYPEWRKFQSKKIVVSYEISNKIADFLFKCAEENEEFYPQSLRIISKTASLFPEKLVKSDYMLLFPRAYKDLISAHCEEYGVPEEVMFALVRSESYFDSQINSSAGACGLAQLMESTAADIAKKLKVADYSLLDPDMNVRFGTWYLQNLYSRLDNNWLHAFFAYNGGKSRISQWISSANYQDSYKRRYDDDLFLEMVPLTETRGYGRKLIGAASMYGMLYYDKEIAETINGLCRQ